MYTESSVVSVEVKKKREEEEGAQAKLRDRGNRWQNAEGKICIR